MTSTSPIVGKNQTLRDAFNKEWEKYSDALTAQKSRYLEYGVYAYYEEKNELVRFCEPYWHKVVAVASSSKLISDPNNKLSWNEIRNIFQNTTIAVAGCSVGGSIIHASMMDIRPENIKIADKSLYKMENINRVRLSYDEIVHPESSRKNTTDLLLRNKALVTAAQIYAIDPYVNIFVYPEGINDSNIKQFFKGHLKEPRADIIVEEVDDPRIKILLRKYAKKLGIPLIMATDIGSCVQIDIVRFDKNRKTSMTYGTEDKALQQSMQKVYDNPGDRKTFFNFVDKLIGTNYRQDELKKIIEGKSEIPTSTIIPQLGSTISVAGGIMAETIARIRLGWDYPNRIIFNKRNFKTITFI
jgi:molybdopterin/thiamine biosynthesis adenylyltransferase